MRDIMSLLENENGSVPFGPIYHRTNDLNSFDQFDLTKASKSAAVGPAVYATFGDTPLWNGNHLKNGKTLKGFISGKILDMTCPLAREDLDTIGAVLGRHIDDGIPILSLERRFGSVAAGLRAAGYSAVIHHGPGTTGKHIAVFDPSSIIHA